MKRVGFDAERIWAAQAREGSQRLLRAMLAYGARHDGLPGLSAERLRHLCAEQRVTTSTGAHAS